MIAIPNMEKPKRCGECDLWSNCFYPKNPYAEQDDYIADDCPLIDIVTCGECKWLGVDDGMPFCYWWLREIEPNVFCSYGERRADGDI